MSSDRAVYQAPVKTITWFDTGTNLDGQLIHRSFAAEQFPAAWAEELNGAEFVEHQLPVATIAPTNSALTTEEWRDGVHASKGTVLRREVYELDDEAFSEGSHVAVRLFTIEQRGVVAHRVQPRSGDHPAVFVVAPAESVTYEHDLALRPVWRYDPTRPSPMRSRCGPTSMGGRCRPCSLRTRASAATSRKPTIQRRSLLAMPS